MRNRSLARILTAAVLAAAMLGGPLLAQTTQVTIDGMTGTRTVKTSTDASGNTVTTTITDYSGASKVDNDGLYTTVREEIVIVTNAAGAHVKTTSTDRIVKRKDKSSPPISTAATTVVFTDNPAGGYKSEVTFNDVNHVTGATEDMTETTERDSDGNIQSGERTTTKRTPGKDPVVEKRKYANGAWQDVELTPPSTTPISNQHGDGAHDETAYMPDVAGPSSAIEATFVDPDQSGPTGTAYVQVEDGQGGKSFLKTLVDEHHHVFLTAVAGAVGYTLFKAFTKDGKPDDAAVRCAVTEHPTVPGTDALANAPQKGLAIQRGASAYDRAGGRGLISLQTRSTNPSDARLLMDGSDANVETVAASDENVKGRFTSDAPFGTHVFSVRSGEATSNGSRADLVELRADPVPPSTPGSIDTVTVHVDGLPPGHAAKMYFAVGGAAVLADGATVDTAPVQDGVAHVQVRGVRDGQAIVHFKLSVELPPIAEQPHPHTTSRPSPEPTRVAHHPEETPTPHEPHDLPTKPPIYGHEPDVPCSVFPTDGYMQMTQGVWQDDKKFPDPHVLERAKTSPYPSYEAPYPMIANRPSLLAGVWKYEWFPGHTFVEPDDRDAHTTHGGHIVLKLKTNCNQLDQVRFAFIFGMDASVIDERYTTEPFPMTPLHGYVKQGAHAKPADYPEFELKLPAGKGWPSSGTYVTPASPGRYVVWCQLQRYDTKLKKWVDVEGVKMTLHGDVVKTVGLTLHYVPTFLSAHDAADDDQVKSGASRVSSQTASRLPDLFPLQPAHGNDSPLPGTVEDPLDLSAEDIFAPNQAELDAGHPINGYHRDRGDESNAKLSERFGLQVLLEDAGRLIVVLRKDDFDKLYPDSAAYTVSRKVIYSQTTTDYQTIGHELTHTLPWEDDAKDFPNDVPWMLAECNRAYHNVSDELAHGLRFLDGGSTARRALQQRYGLMAPAYPSKYIEQCTYRHLSGALQHPPDPPTLLIRGYLFGDGAQAAALGASFSNFYTIDASLDDSSDDPSADLEVVMRDAGGAELKRVSLAPLRTFPDDPVRERRPIVHGVIALNERIPWIEGTHSVELRSKSRGLLASKTLSDAPPAVAVTEPAGGAVVGKGTPFTLRWTAHGTSRGQLYSSVLDSVDAGKTFVTRALELTSDSTSLQIGTMGPHLLRVIVSDGSRSASADVRVAVH